MPRSPDAGAGFSLKHTRLFRATASVLAVCMLLLAGPLPSLQAAATVKAATPLSIELIDSVHSDNLTAGSGVMGRVVADVVVDGRVVIAAGAPAMGKVASRTESNIAGVPGEIMIRFDTVQAVDGSQIPLSNSTHFRKGKSQMGASIGIALLCCILAILIKGEEAVIPAGTAVNCYTANQVVIQ